MDVKINIDPLFIAVEGIDGTGKTTLIQRLEPYIEEKVNALAAENCTDSYQVRVLSPWETSLGQEMRRVMLNKRYTQNNPFVEMMLAAAARHSLVTNFLLQPNRIDNCIYIIDRYLYSTWAYQCQHPEMQKAFLDISHQMVDGVLPGLILHLDMPGAKVEERLGTRDKNRDAFEIRDAGWFEAARQNYMVGYGVFDFSKVNKPTPELHVIDADATEDEVFGAAAHAVDTYLNALFGSGNN